MCLLVSSRNFCFVRLFVGSLFVCLFVLFSFGSLFACSLVRSLVFFFLHIHVWFACSLVCLRVRSCVCLFVCFFACMFVGLLVSVRLFCLRVCLFRSFVYLLVCLFVHVLC